MKEHQFTIILTDDPNDDDESDKLYSLINDGTLSTIVGVPQIRFHREASSLEDAIRSAMSDVKSAGFDISRVEIEPEMIVEIA